MKSFAIRDDIVAPGLDLAYLHYDDRKKEYGIYIPHDVSAAMLPPILEYFARGGQWEVGPEWSRRWVDMRVVPPDRQNLGSILRANGLTEYDDFYFLQKFRGRCCMDDCCLVPLEPSTG